MPRPIKQGLDYFPIDVDFFQNKKIKNLRRDKGELGLITYLNILCKIYRNGYFFSFDDLRELSMDIAEEITNEQLRAKSSRITEIINYLIEHGILDVGLFEQGIISGESMQEQYVLATKAAKRKPKMDVHLLVDVDAVIQKNAVSSEETGVNSEETGVNAEFSAQSKINNSNNKLHLNNTTTPRAPAREQSYQPSLGEVIDKLREYGVENATREAFNFLVYNEERGWDCLPGWEDAAERWVERMR